MPALGNKAVAHGVALLRVGALADEQLLILTQDVGYGDHCAVDLAQGRDAIVIRRGLVVLKIIFFAVLGNFFVRPSIGHGNVESEGLAWLVLPHDRVVVNSHRDLGAIGKLSLSDFRLSRVSELAFSHLLFKSLDDF